MNTQDPLVSIIIPTFNRAHLIGETLDSVLAQTYQNWQCIIVDDGSTDNTDELMGNYVKKDHRFKYYHRPDTHKPGGNGARNYGFEVSEGAYVNWFDDDDLMVEGFIIDKLALFFKIKNIDGVVSKLKYFNLDIDESTKYNFENKDISFLNFAIGNVNWGTPDLMLRREIALRIRYNESILAGQEYNFNCRLLAHTEKIYLIEKVLTLRRHHEMSISSNRKQNKNHYLETKYLAHWNTYLDLYLKVNNPKFEKYSLLQCVSSFLRSKNSFKLSNEFNSHIKTTFGIKFIYFILAKYSNKYFNKYHFFYNKLKK